MLRLLLVLALSPGPATAGGDPLVLVGWWRVATTGETVVIDPARFEVRTDVRTTEGSWVGDGAGRFLTLSYGVPPGSASPGWVATAAGFAVDGPDRVLLDRAGGRVARLVPAAAGTVTGAVDPARPPSDQERRAGSAECAAAAGLTPVGDPTGPLGPDRGRRGAPGLRRLRRRRHVDRLGRLHRHRRLVARGPRWGLPGHGAVAHDVRGLSRCGRGATDGCGAPDRG